MKSLMGQRWMTKCVPNIQKGNYTRKVALPTIQHTADHALFKKKRKIRIKLKQRAKKATLRTIDKQNTIYTIHCKSLNLQDDQHTGYWVTFY